MQQWLRLLALEPGRSGSPLDITRVHVDTHLQTLTVEVPLSYDLLRKYNILGDGGQIRLLIDGYLAPVLPLRGTNGSCLFSLSGDFLPEDMPRTPVRVAVDFVIRPHGHPYVNLHTRGSERTITIADSPSWH